MKEPRCIAITGGTSGIGAALATAYAAPGRIIGVCGRDQNRLQQISRICTAQGARVVAEQVDVTDASAVKFWLQHVEEIAPLDLVIANAGISLGSQIKRLESDSQSVFAVNMDGVLHTIHAALDLMVPRHHGQIAIMSSLAGFRGLPNSPAYSASKVAVKAYGEGLRGFLKPQGIEVNVICPGFVETPMTADNRFAMPFLMTAEQAAARVVRGLSRNKALIAFPWPLFALVWLMRLAPTAVLDFLLSVGPRK